MFFEECSVYPRIVRVNSVNRMHGRFFDMPRDFRLGLNSTVKIEAVCNQGDSFGDELPSFGSYSDCGIELDDKGNFEFDFKSGNEGEYTFRIQLIQEAGNIVPLGNFSCYALEDDLFALRPFKGDTHAHSCFSQCGKISEEPEYTAAMARSRGLDFLFITDHFQHDPSLMTMEKMAQFASDFRVFPGEECHAPRERIPEPVFYNKYIYPAIHHLSLGADRGVIKYTCDHYDEYCAFLEKRMAELDQSVPEDQRHMMAAVDWIVDKTHEFGGVAVYAHPFWRPAMRLNQPRLVREYIMKNARFDAVEVIGLGAGSANQDFTEGNSNCMNWLCDESIKLGRRINVTGSTDMHDSSTLAGYQYTVAFAPECGLEEIKNAIRSGNTVAVSSHPGERRQIWGAYRLVQYTNFLIREFFPEHDEACAIDGKLMLQVQRGDIPLETANAYGKGRLEILRKRYWAAE